MHVSLEQKPTLGEIGGSKMEISEDGTNRGVGGGGGGGGGVRGPEGGEEGGGGGSPPPPNFISDQHPGFCLTYFR